MSKPHNSPVLSILVGHVFTRLVVPKEDTQGLRWWSLVGMTDNIERLPISKFVTMPIFFFQLVLNLGRRHEITLALQGGVAEDRTFRF